MAWAALTGRIRMALAYYRPPRADLPQMVRQDAGRPPRRAESLAHEMFGLPATDPARYSWELVEPGDQDHMPTGQRLLHVVADRMHWLQALDQARRRAEGQSEDLSATGEAA